MRQLIVLLLLAIAVAGCPPAGGLEVMPLDDERVRVNDTLIIDLRVRTAAGNEVWTFSAPSIPDIDRHAALYQSGSTATFRWAPLATHAGTHQFTFTVTSGGASDSETINIEVQQAGGAPRFIQPPPGGTYDLTRSSDIIVAIEVVDEDDVSVEIRQIEPRIEGSELVQLDGFSAEFRWRPTAAQVDATLRYTLHLEADDGEHSPVRHDYEVVLLTEGRTDCDGASPQIASVNVPDRYETVRDYQVTATITDDQGFKDDPILYYTTEAPSDGANPDLTAMQNVSFQPTGSDVYEAFIPNLGLSVDEERIVYFVIVATDNDDTDGTACDHTTRGTLRQFTASAPEQPDLAGYCEPCSNDGQCAGGLCVADESQSYCGTDCDGGCSGGAECREVTSRGGTVDDQCVPPEDETCGGGGGGDCTPDSYEPANDSETSAPVITVGSTVSGSICTDDHDFYAITLATDQRYDVTVLGWDASLADIDVEVLDPAGVSIAYGWGSTDVETFETCTELSGSHLIWIYGYDGVGDYLLEVTEVGGSCCVDDWYEDDDEYGDATSLSCGSGAEAQVCDGDEDWWSITVTEPSTLEVDTVCDTGAGDLDLKVYDTNGTTILGSDVRSSCDSHVEVTLPTAGTYYARVYGWSGGSGGYLVDCSVAGGATCSSTSGCPAGQVCDPGSGCIDDYCDDPGAAGECPSGLFCPEPGGTAASSACVDPCSSSATCRGGYACKIFDDGHGCGEAGSGQTGEPCGDYTDCAGERTCLTAGSTGYCAEIECTTTADCPTDDHTGRSRQALCMDVGTGQRICLMDCLFGDTQCDINPGSCVDSRDVDGTPSWVCALSSHSVP